MRRLQPGVSLNPTATPAVFILSAAEVTGPRVPLRPANAGPGLPVLAFGQGRPDSHAGVRQL